MELYKRIRQRREELGMTQDELADLMKYKSRSSINKIELGKSDIPQSKIKAFATALKTTPEFLMGLNTEETLQLNNYSSMRDGAIWEVYSSLGYNSYKLLSIYEQLPKEQQFSLIDNAEFLAKRYLGDSFYIKSEEETEKDFYNSMYNSPSIEEIEQTEEYKEYLNYESELDAAHQKNNVSEEAKQNEEPKIQEKMQEEIAKRKAMMSDTES
ncbi:transcriptional regulator [Roseburia sp. CAG:380]|nr:transcriptional regulator [Roseburia sp. CAG:380]